MCGDILSIRIPDRYSTAVEIYASSRHTTGSNALKMTAKTRRVPLGKETRHKEKKGKLPVEGALVHEAAHAPASELALAGWLAGWLGRATQAPSPN